MLSKVILLKQQDKVTALRLGRQVEMLFSVFLDDLALKKLLASLPSRVYLVVDSSEEEISIDKSPPLFSWEQADYGHRQLRKRFPKTEFAYFHFAIDRSLPWQSQSGYLQLVGINEDTHLQRLLTHLIAQQVEVMSIHSLALLTVDIFQHLWFSTRRTKAHWHKGAHLLLTQLDRGHFRQTLVVDGQLRTSRQIAIKEDEDIELQATLLLQEVRLLEKFAQAQRFIPFDQRPNVFFIGINSILVGVMEGVLSKNHYLAPYAHACRNMSSMTKAPLSGESTSYILPILAFGYRSSATHYQPFYLKEIQKYRHLKHGLWTALTLWLFLGIGYAAYFYVMTLVVDQQESLLEAEKIRYQHMLTVLESRLKLDFPVEYLKQTVEVADSIKNVQKYQIAQNYFADLARVLSRMPAIQLTSLSMEHEVSVNGNAPTSAIDHHLFALKVEASIVVNKQTRLMMVLETMKQFISLLKSTPSVVNVEITQQPVDLDESKSMSISADESTSGVQVYPFKLFVHFRAAS